MGPEGWEVERDKKKKERMAAPQDRKREGWVKRLQ
jgi:hypothetical protein